MQALGNNEPLTWRAYRAWNRACMLHAWRATRSHFGGGWRSVAEALVPGVAAILVFYNWGGDVGSVPDPIATIATGAAVSLLWIVTVFCWNVGMAPYRLWRAAQARIAQLTGGRRNDPQAIARDLELCIQEGQALMNSETPSKRQLSKWYARVLRVVSRTGGRDRAMLETLGPAPGTRGGALELLILGNRIEKLRRILGRQYSSGARENTGQRRSAGGLPRG
jgi:hypothetical protein